MRHVGEEGALGAVRGLGRILGVVQCLVDEAELERALLHPALQFEVRLPRLRFGPLALLGQLGPHAALADLALHGRRQPRQLVLEHDVPRARPHRLDGWLFADGARDEEEGRVQPQGPRQVERGEAGEARQRPVAEDDVPRPRRERDAHRSGVLDALVLDVGVVVTQRAEGEPRVALRVLDEQDAQRFGRAHGASSLQARTNRMTGSFMVSYALPLRG